MSQMSRLRERKDAWRQCVPLTSRVVAFQAADRVRYVYRVDVQLRTMYTRPDAATVEVGPARSPRSSSERGPVGPSKGVAGEWPRSLSEDAASL